ncbi:hypothetical protein L2E82_49831 [Cichorium intybus]|uniref:Uncharacterized protein n=1 Tax=Cichorium intybus TaxID=13427 RepID=A0ACB8Z2G5_CICIN|nr:hypothetical protein L2E82_49831 [Cichorium intybus]
MHKSLVPKPKRLKSVVISNEERIREELSYVDIVRGAKKDKDNVEGLDVEDSQVATVDDDFFEITVILKEEDEVSMKKVLIGEVKSYDLLQNIFDMPKIEGLLNVNIHYLGGLFVIMEFEAEESADDFLKKAKPSLSNWFHDLFKLWGMPVRIDKDEDISLNKEAKRVGILTNEEPWINEYVNIKIKGNYFKVRVVEDPSRSFGLAPKLNYQDLDQSSDEGWLDLDNERMGMDEHIEETEKV